MRLKIVIYDSIKLYGCQGVFKFYYNVKMKEFIRKARCIPPPKKNRMDEEYCIILINPRNLEQCMGSAYWSNIRYVLIVSIVCIVLAFL